VAWLAWAALLAALILGLGGLDDAQVGGLLGGAKILDVGWTAALVAGVLAGAGATATLLRRGAQDVVPAPERPTVPVH
jgi:hypothetical protein